MNKLFLGLLCLTLSSAAMAQDYGLTIGIHQTTGSVDPSSSSNTAIQKASGSVNGKLGFDAGLTASFELMPAFRFRSGILYDQRQIDFKLNNNAGTISFNFVYIDVPVNVQYNFTPMFGLYGGLIVGIKASDSTSIPNGVNYSPDMKSLYPLVSVGGNFMFNDMIGFDVYYEAGLGNAAEVVKNYSTFGLHFIYWL